ncbi:hypothetical protein XHC_0195 [Xanthomonas hortorum pv. carotae str. M081]|nr:hypothetical protein XHC_0195 [Xanthomonas hortorum pv. carotae str. M081]
MGAALFAGVMNRQRYTQPSASEGSIAMASTAAQTQAP